MAEISRFFADVAGDRLTTAAQWNRIFDQLLQEKDGVIRGLGNTLAVTNSGAVAVDVNTGSAIMGGRLYENTASKNLVLDAVTSGSKRYDRIVVRVDETARTMLLTVIKGVEGASPSVPAIDGTTDVLLAKILLDRSSGSYVYTVTDERVYCDGLLLPSIIALLNAGTKVVPGAAGAADADAIAAATGATLYARLFGILDATWGNGGLTPQKKGSIYTVSTSNDTATTIATLPNADRTYLATAYLGTQAPNYSAFAIIQTSADGSAIISLQDDALKMYITLSGMNIQLRQTSGVSQTVVLLLFGLQGV